ncbi:uncharacterized protein BDV17DRAFT_265614 [Aspergillus undulatus]|uniref:uncharacterized protein n=1 Tax=Aspergillus undulatus TaxID=1810928 RepID=UPI003CCDCF46
MMMRCSRCFLPFPLLSHLSMVIMGFLRSIWRANTIFTSPPEAPNQYRISPCSFFAVSEYATSRTRLGQSAVRSLICHEPPLTCHRHLRHPTAALSSSLTSFQSGNGCTQVTPPPQWN